MNDIFQPRAVSCNVMSQTDVTSPNVNSEYFGISSLHVAPWDIFWSVNIETISDENCLFFWSKYLNHFSIKITHKDLI